MKRCAILLLLVAIVAQAQVPQLSDFYGTWKAEFHKQTWLTLTLSASKSTLVHSTEMSADDEGDITSVGEEMSTDQVVRVELQDATLHVTTRDEDGNTDQYVLVFSGKDTADLHPVVAGGASGPKPFHLKRIPLSAPQK
jgi:hypothetical protein